MNSTCQPIKFKQFSISKDCSNGALLGNGVCNDETNNPECNFDGGDCCGHCAAISVTLENNALVAQGYYEGIYHNSSMVNGKASWTSTSQAIWKYTGQKIEDVHIFGVQTLVKRLDFQ